MLRMSDSTDAPRSRFDIEKDLANVGQSISEQCARLTRSGEAAEQLVDVPRQLSAAAVSLKQLADELGTALGTRNATR